MSENQIRGIQWIDYNNMKEFYTIEEICQLFGLSKDVLHLESNFFNVKPHKRGNSFGFTCHEVRRLHNSIYMKDQELIEQEAWK